MAAYVLSLSGREAKAGDAAEGQAPKFAMCAWRVTAHQGQGSLAMGIPSRCT